MSSGSDQTLLLACLHQDTTRLDPAALPGADSPRWDSLVALAAAQRVRPLLHRRLRVLRHAHPIPAPALAALEQAARATTMRNLRFQAETAAVARALQPLGVDTLVLKGAHLATSVYEQIGLREMSDIDLLVRREHLAAAVEVLTARGYAPLQAFSIELDTAFHHHLTRFVKADTAGIELHWTLTIPTEPHGVDPLTLWGRAQPLDVGGVRVYGLSQEDLLLHLCYHTSYQHQFRFGLRPFCDVAALTARRDVPLDWQMLVARARDWTWDRGVYLTLRLAHEMVGAPIPAHALEALARGGFDEDVLRSAHAQVFDEGGPAGLEPGVARLASDESLSSRLRHLAHRIAPPRRELARLYGVSESSPRLALSYLRRAFDVARRHAGPATRLLLSRDARLTDSAARSDLLRRWLS
jgi:Uncharacterised nucleotidyltransferase